MVSKVLVGHTGTASSHNKINQLFVRAFPGLWGMLFQDKPR